MQLNKRRNNFCGRMGFPERCARVLGRAGEIWLSGGNIEISLNKSERRSHKDFSMGAGSREVINTTV